jgi:methylated-DNA-protein-cysteine methyltransferase-like protein
MKFFTQVYTLVRRVPTGCVATYGQIAHLLGQPHAARTVGWALRDLPQGSNVPWHRVINAAGRISISEPLAAAQQRRLLEAEGVVFNPDGCVDLDRFGWVGLSELEIRSLIADTEGGEEPTEKSHSANQACDENPFLPAGEAR